MVKVSTLANIVNCDPYLHKKNLFIKLKYINKFYTIRIVIEIVLGLIKCCLLVNKLCTLLIQPNKITS